MPIKLYQYSGGLIRETEAERETANFWVIRGSRESKILIDYPEQVWYRTAEEAIRAVINHAARKRDKHLSLAQLYQDRIDKASDFLWGLGKYK